MTQQLRLGFIGLGLMGRPMALNLIKAGYGLTVWARRAESMQPLLEAGAAAAHSAAEVAACSDVVISMVADAPDVAQVCLGPQGVAAGAGPAERGLIHIDMSTIAPVAAQGLASQMAEHGVRFLDAPVSGGELGAINAALTIMVGGDQAAFEQVRPVLLAMGKTVTYIGASGAGQVTKACNQILTGVGVAMVAEALNFARASGVDPARVREAMLGGFAYSRILENHGQRMLDGNFKPGFKAWMHQKDVHIVLSEARRLGVATPTTAACAGLFDALVAAGEGEQDSVALIGLLQGMPAEGSA